MDPDTPAPRPKPRRSPALRTLRSLAACYILWCLMLSFLERRLVYLPHLAGEPTPDARIDADPRIERLWLTHPDGVRTESWLLRAPKPARGLACFLHGNGELIDGTLHEARMWNARGYDALLVEYRGYGRSGGTPSQRAIVPDTLRMADQALARTGHAAFILHGRSLGTGVAAQVAALAPARTAALILESPFESIAGFAWRYGVPPFLVSNSYRTDAVLPTLAAPVLILNARDDEIIPFDHGVRLAQRARNARHVALEGTHNSGLSLDPAYWSAIDALLPDLGTSPRR